jgi:hypothetical protein
MIFSYTHLIHSKLLNASKAITRFRFATLCIGAIFFSCSFHLAQAQQVSESADLKVARSNAATSKFGIEPVELELLPDPSIVFADSNFRFSYNHFATQQVITPFPIQVSESGEIINYTIEEWESILGRLSNTKSTFDFDKYRTQFLTCSMDFLNLRGFEENLNPLIVPPWLAPYLAQQFESQMEYIVKSQLLLGNVCIIDANTGMPAAKNISLKGLPKGSPNAMLAYTSLVNRWLFARPEMAGQVLKAQQADFTLFSDPLKLCQLFAPSLVPNEKKSGKTPR